MKWPLRLTLIRHGQSEYNFQKEKKEKDPEYQRFAEIFPDHDDVHELAVKMRSRYALGCGDHNTPLTPSGQSEAVITGRELRARIPILPDVIIYSPFLRTVQTWQGLVLGWPELRSVQAVEDDRIREQDHGLASLCGDWRIFHALYPEQAELYKQTGRYWYRYPQGESAADVRDRVRSMMTTLVREYACKRVWMITHHLTILSIRANLERLTPEQFIELDETDKPVNCGVTTYQGYPAKGDDGRLVLESYNKRYVPE